MSHITHSLRGVVLATLITLEALYVVCLFWGNLTKEAALKTLHANSLAIAFPGLNIADGLTVGEFFYGAVALAVYVIVIAGVWTLLYNALAE